jgi:phage gpG-like protein
MTVALTFDEGMEKGLHEAVAIAKAQVEKDIGNYQPDAGPNPAWAPLADATKEDRLAKGFSADDPLDRSGDLKGSIETYVHKNHGYVGTNQKGAEALEFGTPEMPPRSFLATPVYQVQKEIVAAIGRHVVSHLAGDNK